MRQEVVVRLNFGCKKSQSKALQIVSKVPGVESVALLGEDKNQIKVCGDGMDAVYLTTQLRKKLGFAEILRVTSINRTEEWEEITNGTVNRSVIWPTHQTAIPQYYFQEPPHNQPDTCNVL